MATNTTIRIPSLRSWEKNTNGYQLFRAGLGYLHIKPMAGMFCLSLRPDLDGVNVGLAEPLSIELTPEACVAKAQEYVANGNKVIEAAACLWCNGESQAHTGQDCTHC